VPIDPAIKSGALQPYWVDHFIGKTLAAAVKAQDPIRFVEIGETQPG
jgi:hypothetical protein